MKKNLFAAEPRTEQAEAREIREPQTRRLSAPDYTASPCGLPDHILAAVVNGLRLHDHAMTASIRVVIYLFLTVQRIIAYLVGTKLNMTASARTSDDAFTHHPFTHFRKECRNVNPHRRFLRRT